MFILVRLVFLLLISDFHLYVYTRPENVTLYISWVSFIDDYSHFSYYSTVLVLVIYYDDSVMFGLAYFILKNNNHKDYS